MRTVYIRQTFGANGQPLTVFVMHAGRRGSITAHVRAKAESEARRNPAVASGYYDVELIAGTQVIDSEILVK